MSRIRSIHPGLFTDEAFVSLSPLARVFWLGLWTECDDNGSFEWSPLKLKMRLLPADNADAAELLAEIEAENCIMQYDVAGKRYGAVRNFCQYQRPKKPNNIHPQTDLVREWVNTEARSKRDGSEGVGNQLPIGGEKSRLMEDEGGREGGKNPPTPLEQGGKKARSGKSLIPDDWQLPAVADLPPQARACAEQWTDASYATHGEAFKGYWSTNRRMQADWRLTWANRIVAIHSTVMRDQKYGNAPTGSGAAAKPMSDEQRAAYFESLAKLDAKMGRHNDNRPTDAPPPERRGGSRPIGQLLRHVGTA